MVKQSRLAAGGEISCMLRRVAKDGGPPRPKMVPPEQPGKRGSGLVQRRDRIRAAGRSFAMEHPSSVDWALMMRAGLPTTRSVEMAEHLGTCQPCRETVDALASPPRRILGRPVPAPSGATVTGLEDETAKLLALLRAGGVLR